MIWFFIWFFLENNNLLSVVRTYRYAVCSFDVVRIIINGQYINYGPLPKNINAVCYRCALVYVCMYYTC